MNTLQLTNAQVLTISELIDHQISNHADWISEACKHVCEPDGATILMQHCKDLVELEDIAKLFGVVD